MGIFSSEPVYDRQNTQRDRMKKRDAVRRIVETPPSNTDPQGSWTGKPMDEDDVPVQDADDL